MKLLLVLLILSGCATQGDINVLQDEHGLIVNKEREIMSRFDDIEHNQLLLLQMIYWNSQCEKPVPEESPL